MALRFVKQLPASTALRFGALDAAPVAQFDLTLAATSSVLATGKLVIQAGQFDLSLNATTSVSATGNLSLQAGYFDLGLVAYSDTYASGSLGLDYDNAVTRAPVSIASSGWSAAKTKANLGDISTPGATAKTVWPQLVSPSCQPAIAERLMASPRVGRLGNRPAVHWGNFAFASVTDRPAWRSLDRLPLQIDISIGRSTLLGMSAGSHWVGLLPRPRPMISAPWGRVSQLGSQRCLVISHVAGRVMGNHLVWSRVRWPQPGKSTHVIPVDPVTPHFTPSATLRFRDPLTGSAVLRFGYTKTSSGTVDVPIRSIYVIENSLSLVISDTGQVLPITDISLSTDCDSWSWGWSAKVGASFMPALMAPVGELIEVNLSINGELFKLLVDPPSRDREFAKADLKIGGRSRSAWLADPYSSPRNMVNTQTRNAQQLMLDALTENGVSLGWGIDWQITDWPVPAGCWNHRGTPLSACSAIAQAAGAYLQTHQTDDTLIVLPRYPAAPWKWSTDLTPDINLPEDVCTVEGVEYVDKPIFNTVYVAGEENGILGHITRAGTDGGKPAEMATDPLITHADAARQRGVSILSDTGRQERITLKLPILSETGIIKPGKLVRYTESGNSHLGLCRAVSVSGQFPVLSQSITLESHVL